MQRFTRLNSEVDLGLLARTRLGMDIRGGEPAMARCVFHPEDSTHSLALYQRGTKQGGWNLPHYHCHACGASGTALDLIQHVLGFGTTKEAADWLEGTDRASFRYTATNTPTVAEPTRNLRPAVDKLSARLFSNDGAGAREYLDNRRLLEVASAYQLGLWWNDGTTWSNRLVIPYLTSLEPDSEVVGLKGRSLDGAEPKYRCSKGVSLRPYLWEVALPDALQRGYIYLVEGELDALSLLTLLGTDTPVVGVPGLQGFSETYAAQLAGLHVFLILDRDKAGDAARPRYEALLTENNATVQHLYLPDIGRPKSDLNDTLCALGIEGGCQWLADALESSENHRNLI